MYKHQKDVKEFHEKYEHLINDKPTIPDEATLKLRCKLLLEEVLEFCTAAGFSVEATNTPNVYQHNLNVGEGNFIAIEPYEEFKVTLIEMADALADIQYVNDGAAISLGVDLEPIATEVHRSNMSKLWNVEEVQVLRSDTNKNWNAKGNTTDGFCVKNEHGKVIKSPSYSPADIKKELELQSK